MCFGKREFFSSFSLPQRPNVCACADESLAERGTCGMFAELSSVRKEIIEMERDLLWTFFSSPFLGGSKNVVCVCVVCVWGGAGGLALSDKNQT